MAAALLLLGYSVTVVTGFAVVAWGVVRRFGHLGPGAAAAVAVTAGLVAVALPVAGLAVDSVRAGELCGPGEECYDFVAAWLAVPLGWAAAVAVVGAGVVAGRLGGNRYS